MGNLNFKNCRNVVDSLLSLFKVPEIQSPSIPLPLRLGARNKPGLNSEVLFGEVIEAFDELGLISSDLDRAREKVRLEKIIQHFCTRARAEGTLPPGGINMIGQGANAGGPIIIQGQNLNLPNIVSSVC